MTLGTLCSPCASLSSANPEHYPSLKHQGDERTQAWHQGGFEKCPFPSLLGNVGSLHRLSQPVASTASCLVYLCNEACSLRLPHLCPHTHTHLCLSSHGLLFSDLTTSTNKAKSCAVQHGCTHTHSPPGKRSRVPTACMHMPFEARSSLPSNSQAAPSLEPSFP